MAENPIKTFFDQGGDLGSEAGIQLLSNTDQGIIKVAVIGSKDIGLALLKLREKIDDETLRKKILFALA